MKLKEIRKLKGMTRKELAEKLQMSESTLEKYEYGIYQPSIETLTKLADLFEISVDTLIGHDSQLLDMALLDNNRKLAVNSVVYKLSDVQVSKVLTYIIDILAK